MDGCHYKICLIAEGNEEYQFFETMVDADAIHQNFSVDCISAGGFGNVAPLFQDFYSYPTYDCIICVYDVDCRQDETGSPYCTIRAKLKMILGSDKAVDKVSFCTNPNFLQIYLLAKDVLSNVKMQSTSKETNTPLVHRYWPEIGREKQDSKSIKNYDAVEWQLRIMNGMFLSGKDTYDPLMRNCCDLPSDYINECPGSNVPSLIRALLDGDIQFFQSIAEDL